MGPRPVVQVEKKIEPIVIEQPGSIFTEIDLREDSVYATGVYDQEYIDGSVEIR